MQIFIKNLSLFLLPIAAFFIPSFIVLLWSGEFYPLHTVEGLMNQPRAVVIGQAYSNFGQELQVDEVTLRRPEVITLGNSHVGEFRSVFFKDPNVFYNTTGAAAPLSDYIYFIERLASTTPHIIIANMEQTMFNPEDAKNHVATRPNPFTARSNFYDPFVESFFRNSGWWKVYADYFSKKFTLTDVVRPQNSALIIGLRARATGDGSRNDGSSYWSTAIHNSLAQQQTRLDIDALAARITDTYGDEYDTEISSAALAELRKFLVLSRSRGVFIIGFLPPIAHEEYQALENHSDATYAYAFRNLGPTLAAIYKEYGFDFYDFSDISSFGSADNEMVEAKHGSEKMYLRMFINMAERSTPLTPLTDIHFLKATLANATSTYYAFGVDGE